MAAATAMAEATTKMVTGVAAAYIYGCDGDNMRSKSGGNGGGYDVPNSYSSPSTYGANNGDIGNGHSYGNDASYGGNRNERNGVYSKMVTTTAVSMVTVGTDFSATALCQNIVGKANTARPRGPRAMVPLREGKWFMPSQLSS